jgi:hypothetical protein
VAWKPRSSGETAPSLPVETLRHWYLSVCGGWSPELAFSQIGINREALARNTSLRPERDRVRVAVVGRLRRPYLLDHSFQVVPLDDARPKAAALSPGGEVVFAEGDDVLRFKDAPHLGEEVILNGVAAERLRGLPDLEAFAGILAELFRRGRVGDRENV